MIIAVVLVVLFVALIGSLMWVGWRHRPALELPPRFPDRIELPPAYRRWRLRLLAVRAAAWVIGVAAYLGLRAAGLRLAADVVGIGAIVVYVSALLTSVGIGITAARLARKEGRRRAAGIRSSE